ncbi:hypothetical protein [Leifsonia xyli]|uniref:hypothetical protein n=1 Tax=Leifsonia xyli TaxID=1575 RepID=UPI003D666794
MSPEQREWLKKEIAAGRNPFRNFVNEWDPIGNSRGNTSGTAIFVHGLPGQDPLQYHNLDTGFHFTDGRITNITKTGRSRLEISENLLQGVPPAYRTAVAAGVSGAMTVLRNPLVGESVGRSVSAMLVAMDTLAAASLASSIFSTSDLLTQVKSVNSSLVPQLQVSLHDACRAVSGIPCITATDIENCVITERLSVSDNIDEQAVTAVNRLVDDHVATVHRLTAGIGAAMSNAVEQDARWASIFAGR